MESNRFDAITRTLTSTGSRRGAVRAMAVAGLGLGMTRLGLENAAAKKKKKKKNLSARCGKTDECKGNLLCQNANSQNGCYDQTEKRCCKKEGEHCEDGCECCGVDVICNGNFCQSA